MQELKGRINAAVKDALKAKESEKLGTLRMILAGIKQREVDERIELDDTGVLAVIDKMMKQRRESIAEFEKAGRQDLADKEAREIATLKDFLPAALGDAEIDAMVASAVTESGATSMRDMAKVMAILRPKLQGRADLGAVSAKVKTRLNG